MNSKPQRPAFMPLSPDIDDTRLEQLAREKGVGTFERPVREEKGAHDPLPVAVVAPAESSTSSLGADSPTPRAEMKTLNLELPDYVWVELKIRAARQHTTLRHLVMVALVKDGVTIADIDMVEDGRRLRS